MKEVQNRAIETIKEGDRIIVDGKFMWIISITEELATLKRKGFIYEWPLKRLLQFNLQWPLD